MKNGRSPLPHEEAVIFHIPVIKVKVIKDFGLIEYLLKYLTWGLMYLINAKLLALTSRNIF